jgi:antitoxin VapB
MLMGMPETRTFKSGNSEAVRLPQGIGFGVGVAVNVERDGDRVVITPTRNPAEEKARLLALLADLEAIGGAPDGVQDRDPFEFPERRGL